MSTPWVCGSCDGTFYDTIPNTMPFPPVLFGVNGTRWRVRAVEFTPLLQEPKPSTTLLCVGCGERLVTQLVLRRGV